MGSENVQKGGQCRGSSLTTFKYGSAHSPIRMSKFISIFVPDSLALLYFYRSGTIPQSTDADSVTECS